MDPYDSYYNIGYPSIAEQLSDGTFFMPQGEAIVTGTSSAVSGGFNALFEHYDSRFPSIFPAPGLLGFCRTPLTQLTLTRQ